MVPDILFYFSKFFVNSHSNIHKFLTCPAFIIDTLYIATQSYTYITTPSVTYPTHTLLFSLPRFQFLCEGTHGNALYAFPSFERGAPVAVLPSVSATSDSIAIPLDRLWFPHLFHTLYYIIYTVLPSRDPLAPFQRTPTIIYIPIYDHLWAGYHPITPIP